MALPVDHKAHIIDGKAIAQTIRSEISSEVTILVEKYGKAPGLAVVIVGHRKDSQSYVTMKRKPCAEVGIKFIDIDLPEQIPEAELTAKLQKKHDQHLEVTKTTHFGNKDHRLHRKQSPAPKKTYGKKSTRATHG